MTIYNPNITWPGTSGSSNKKKNPSTPILTEQNTYGDYFNSLGNTSTPTISDPNIKPAESSGNIGNTYWDILTPNELTAPTTPIYTPVFGGENSLVGNSVVGGGSAIGGNLVKPVDPSQYFDGGVVGTVGGGFSGGNKGGVSDEGIIADNPKVDNSTFNANVGSGSSVSVSPTVSKKPKTQQNIPNSGNEITTGNTGTKVDTNVSVNESTGVVEQKPVTAPTTPTTTPTTDAKTEETPVMTYEEYIAEQKAIEEEKRKAALKQAQVYKERAAADAQASYMQNMSAYGVNAENMAKMGLTGGGYSDYLNAQAYAQKRDDMQVASATELAMKQQAETTYADGIAALNKEKFAYQQSEKQNKTNAYNSLLGYAMDANSGLTEESIRSMAQSAGLSEEETQNVINTMNASKANAESKNNESYSKSTYNMLWEAVQDPNTTYTEEGIRALAKKAGMSEEDTNALISMFKSTQARKTEEEKKVQDDQAAAEQEEKTTYSAGLKSETMATIEANGGMSVDYINSLKGYGMSDADIAEVVEYNNKYIFDASVSTLNTAKTNGDIATMEKTLTQADKYYKDGQMTTERYQELYSIYSTYSVDTVMGMDYGSDYKKKLNTILDQKSEIEEQYKAGKISKATYDTLMGKINAQTSNTAKGGWYIQGLGSGRNNDDVDITIGGTSRNKDTEYDFLCGDAIKDSNLVAELNRIATGDPTKTPSTSGEGSGWFFGVGSDSSISSNDKPNKLIVAYGNMYLYTTKGWVPLKNDNNDYDLGNAIRAFLGS